VIREIVVLVHNEVSRAAITVHTELAGSVPRIPGDRVQLQQVMMNLILNGIEAMKEADGTRELHIESRHGGDGQLEVCVRDTGVGLPKQQAEQIFDAFFTTKRHGTGIGLSVSRAIVESHNGRLWADDHAPRGACFHMSLQAPKTAWSRD
jgi:signal transduction histidine kinase